MFTGAFPMKKFHNLLSLVLVCGFVLTACNLGATAEATEPPTEPGQAPLATEPPALTEVPVQPSETATLVQVPLDLSGPPMEVGSKFLYVDGSVLVAVPGGPFIMGHGGPDNPEHEVNISNFWLYRSKVTNSQYAFCVTLGKCSPPHPDKGAGFGDPLKANHPVTGVNYQQAAEYCSFVNGRLPTEAEWEKAARGPEGNIYPWGDATPQCDLANYGTCEFETTKVIDHPAGQSYYEAFDMAGNVYEWVSDWYDANYYNNSPVDDPLGPDLAFRRSVRSSGFNSPAYESESARRFSLAPVEQLADLGFRCVVEDPTYFAPMCTAALVYGQDASGNISLGGFSNEVCPQVKITQNAYCNGLQPLTNIELIGPSDANFDPNGCTPTGNPNQYVCLPPGGTVSISAECDLTIDVQPKCPPGFQQQGNTCISQGGQGQCLPGFNYDPASQCCTALPGQDATLDVTPCPVGTFFHKVLLACVPIPAQGIVSVTEVIGFNSCVPEPTKTREPGPNCPQYGSDMAACTAAGCTFDLKSYTCK
jgi:formylglycine-generating enzyme required for sulfatase activity